VKTTLAMLYVPLFFYLFDHARRTVSQEKERKVPAGTIARNHP
jgi:hypothetical protein